MVAVADDADRHYFREKGAAAERTAQEIALSSFFSDWCYLNPRTADGKELCDLLVVFGNVAVVWQVKSLKLRADGHYKAGEVSKNIRQAVGAMRRLLDVKRPLVLRNPRRGEEEFDPTAITERFLVSVLVGEGEDFFPIIEEVDGLVVHAFTGDFMDLVLHELDTAKDFTDYLRAKEELLASTQIIVLGGEEELLASYLKDGKSFDRLKKATMVTVESGLWDDYRQSPDYAAKRKADEVSYAWDSVIDRAHESNDPAYERVARELARLSRFERRCAAQAMYEAAVTAHEDRVYPVYRRTMDLNGRTYVFLFMDDPERKNRQQQLQALCYVARGKFPNNQVVIGIATEKRLRPECSYDYCYMEIPEWTPEDEEKATLISDEAGFYKSVTVRQGRADEYPTDGAPMTVGKVGRNSPCPCGSGRKYKRCCGAG